MKTLLAVFIIGFWLFFPFPVILMNNDSFNILDTSYYNKIDSPVNQNTNIIEGFNTFFTNLWNFIKIYFQAMFFIIPNAPPFISLIVLFFQVISGLVLFLLFREG